MGVYMKNLKEKIWLSWFPYLAFKYPMDFKSADAVISFTLNQKGEVTIKAMTEQSAKMKIRVGIFGDEVKSQMVLNVIQKHL